MPFPRAAGTHAAVLFAGLPASSGTIVASRRLLRGAGVASFPSVGSSSSNPSPCWRQLDTAAQRPHTHSYHRRSRTLRRGSDATQGRSGSYECHDLRDARPLALEYSFGSFPNRCRPNAARAFLRVYEALRSESGLRSLAGADLPRQVLPITIRSEGKQMTLEQVLYEISSLTPSEQLKIAQVIWDRLPDDFGTDLSPAQQAELDRRWTEYKKDPSSALSLEEFRERMRVARGK